MYTQDTIVAISTALGEGAIGLVRLSGPEAIAIANRLFPEKDLVTPFTMAISKIPSQAKSWMKS